MKIMKVINYIAITGDTLEDSKLVLISLKGISPQWHNFCEMYLIHTK